MRPDVTIIAPYPPAGQRHGGHSGVASYSANLATALAADGVDVTVLAPELDGDPDVFVDGSVRVRRDYPRGRRALPSALRAAAATGSPVVHLQWELFLYGGPPSLVGLVPALVSASRRLGAARLVTTLHQVVAPSTIDRAYTALHRIEVPPLVARAGIAAVQAGLLRASAATIVHEEAFASQLDGATVIPHGVETPTTPDRAWARRHLGLGDEFVVLCFGFVAPYKGLEVALDAARVAGPGIQLVVAGGEHPRLARGGSSYAAELRARSPHARFTGHVPDGDVAAWFSAADIALLAYPRPFAASGVLALAIAHGTPLVVSPALARCAGMPNVLEGPLDPQGLGATMRQLAVDPAAVADRRRWTERLATGRRWNDVATRTAELYEEVRRGEHRAGRRFRAA